MCTVQVTERRVEGKIRAGEKIGNGASAASKEIEGEIVYSRSPWRVAHFPPLLSDCSFAYDGPFFSFSLSRQRTFQKSWPSGKAEYVNAVGFPAINKSSLPSQPKVLAPIRILFLHRHRYFSSYILCAKFVSAGSDFIHQSR